MTGGLSRRYPLQDLLAALGNPDTFATRLGLNRGRVAELLEIGLTERSAERLAVKCGKVPYEVWPEMLDHVIADAEQVCAARDCDERFMASKYTPNRKFCSARCRERNRRQGESARARERRLAARRAWYRRNREKVLAEGAVANLHPSVAEAKRLYRRAYYQANRERELARQREYDRARSAAMRSVLGEAA